MKKLYVISAIYLFFLLSNFHSTNAQWIKVSRAPSDSFSDIIFADDNFYLTSINSGVYKSTDSTKSWFAINNGLNNGQAIIANQIIYVNGVLYLATVDGVYKSTNAGELWIRKSDGIEIGDGAKYIFAESIFEIDGVLLTGTFGGIYYSTNGGDDWLPANVTGSHVNAKSFTEHNGIIFAARESINEPNGYYSEDGGFSWEEMNNIHPTITFFSEELKLWAGTIHGVRLSTDNGETWEIKNDGLNADPYNTSIIRINGELFTSLKFGAGDIYRSANEGDNWISYNEGLPSLLSIYKLFVFDEKVFAVTGEGLWQRSIITSYLPDEDFVETDFSLLQNYPNPFNPTTTIRFTIPSDVTREASNVKLIVYDVLGREVATLVNQRLQPGNHEVEFDASSFTSGVYFYHLKAGDFVQSRKMILQK